jgi:hypothetical protein
VRINPTHRLDRDPGGSGVGATQPAHGSADALRFGSGGSPHRTSDGGLAQDVGGRGCLPLNRPGAAGFVSDGQVWFVSKRLADEVRAYLAAHESAAGIPGPEKNDRLFDVWQEYGALVANPETGGAIWRVRVQADGFDQVLTLLRFPLEKLYPTPASYPANFAGRVIPLPMREKGRRWHPAEGVPDWLRACRTLAHSAVDGGNFSPVVVLAFRLPPMPRPGGEPEPEPAAEEFLEEDDATHFLPRPPDGHRIAPMRLPDKPIKPDRLAKPKAAAQGPSEAALRFMGWLQQGLANGSIAHNETGAMVHFAAEGMLLISPRIFRHFAERFGEKGDGTPSNLVEDKLGTGIQREVIKAGWHLLGPKKTNVHKYQVVRRNGKGWQSAFRDDHSGAAALHRAGPAGQSAPGQVG